MSTSMVGANAKSMVEIPTKEPEEALKLGLCMTRASCTVSEGAIEVKRAQIGDLEMGSMIPPGLNARDARLSNPM
ncbi:hypothetical protein EMCG_04576 [[Emmonsia] crescens]|uniref:Uncharacterized protein n=1 Tax=[Emmonsia] crescens TaxID=73230 RepID=A0A0G2J7B7_9EURO|nr:hypothetical protein EMCG_04576 [Emmonsia crescens UAMH 3008]